MRGVVKGAIAAVVVAAVAAGVAASTVWTNGGFEDGNLNGWSAPDGNAGAATAVGFGSGTVFPTEGSYLGVVGSGFVNHWYTLSQTVTLGDLDTISGDLMFATYDYYPFLDQGQVLVLDSSATVVSTEMSESVGTVGNFSWTGWRDWDHQVSDGGDFTIQARVRNILDSSVQSYTGLDALEYERGVIVVTMDIKPGSDTNPVNLKSGGVIPVAVLGSADFDVSTVDVSSLAFGPGGASESHGKGHVEDVNGDGHDDLVLHFDTKASGLAAGDTSATLTGQVSDGTPLEGIDVVSVK